MRHVRRLGAVTLVGGADTSVVDGNCYRYRVEVSDNVGNQSAPSAVSADAKIDTSAPTIDVTAPTPVTGGAQPVLGRGHEDPVRPARAAPAPS